MINIAECFNEAGFDLWKTIYPDHYQDYLYLIRAKARRKGFSWAKLGVYRKMNWLERQSAKISERLSLLCEKTILFDSSSWGKRT